MSLNPKSSVLPILVIAALSGLFAQPVRAEDRKPNFVVIFTDDLGYGDISCYSPKGVKTPHIDALSEEGFRSTDFLFRPMCAVRRERRC